MAAPALDERRSGAVSVMVLGRTGASSLAGFLGDAAGAVFPKTPVGDFEPVFSKPVGDFDPEVLNF